MRVNAQAKTQEGAMHFLSRRHALVGYVSGLSAILGLMLMVMSGITAVQMKPAGEARISMLDRR
jgi:hypothetical protein